MEKQTAIILVTYNGWALTEVCLKDLLPLVSANDAETAGHFVVAIADNGSSDGTVEKIRAHFPWVHLYPQKGNLGFGAANNGAIKGLIADGIEFDAICLLNNDTRFNPEAIVTLRKNLDQAAEAGHEAIIAPTTLNADGSRQNNFFAGLGPDGIGAIPFFLNAFRSESGAARILEGTPAPADKNGLQEVHWASAVCWMLHRALWKTVGGFDEKIFMYYEDADLALRFRKLGARFYIAQNAPITHLGGGSASNNLSRALQHDRSQQYVFRKHFGLRGLLLSKLFRMTRSLVRILTALPRCLAGASAKQKREYLRHHLALLKEAFK